MDFIEHQNQLIQEANKCISHIEEDLQLITQLKMHSDETDSELDNLRSLQLVLQFRLDTQDALRRLLQFGQSVWQILGISSQNSTMINLERLSFALGSSDLHHALSMLNRLIDALLRVLQRHYLSSVAHPRTVGKSKTRVLRQAPGTSRLYQKMVRVVDYQKSFIFILNQLTSGLVAREAEPVVGPLLDHICKLEGPISHFYQALQNGLRLSEGIYAQLEETCQLNKKLDELVLHATMILDHSDQPFNQPRLYQPTKEISSSQDLEARAAEKRLGYFFRPY